MPLPPLSHRAIAAYNRLGRELSAFNYVLHHTKCAGPIGPRTIFTFNGIVLRAGRLFSRHKDLPRLVPVGMDEKLTQADLAILVAQVTAACFAFEERYERLTEAGIRKAQIEEVRQLQRAPLNSDGLPSPHR